MERTSNLHDQMRDAGRLGRRTGWRRWFLSAAVLIGLGLSVYWLIGMTVRSNAQATLRAAASLRDRNKPQAARRSLRWLLHYEPAHPHALLTAARCLQDEGRLDDSAKMFRRVPVDSKQHETASFELAHLLLLDGRLAEAERALRQHLGRYPHSRAVREELRWLLFNQFRTRELERFLLERLARPPGSLAILVDLLMTEMRSPVPREGIGYLQQVNRRQPGQPSVQRALAYCHWQLGNLDKARRLLNAAWSADPSHPETRFLAAEFAIEQNDLDSAAACLTGPSDSARPAAGSLRDDDRWWWLRSRLAERRDRPAEALELLDRALELRPFELGYVHRRGRLLRALGQPAEADRWAEKAAVIEAAQKRLTEIVLSGALQNLTTDLCREIAELCERRGRLKQAAGWRAAVERLQNSAAERVSTRFRSNCSATPLRPDDLRRVCVALKQARFRIAAGACPGISRAFARPALQPKSTAPKLVGIFGVAWLMVRKTVPAL